MFTFPYSPEENKCILDELKNQPVGLRGHEIRREMFIAMEKLWPPLFMLKRSQRGLFLHMIRLAEKEKIGFHVVSCPKRVRYKHPPSEKKQKSPKLKEQILAIIRREHSISEKRISQKVLGLISEIASENAMLSSEIRELRTFKRDIEITRNIPNPFVPGKHSEDTK